MSQIDVTNFNGNDLIVAMPGPYYEGTDFLDQFEKLKEVLAAAGHHDDVTELDDIWREFVDATEHLYSRVTDVLERHGIES